MECLPGSTRMGLVSLLVGWLKNVASQSGTSNDLIIFFVVLVGVTTKEMPIFKTFLAWLTAFSLLFMSYFAAQIWHKPTLNGTHYDFTDVVLNTREKVTAWNACCRANWCIGLGILVFICDRGKFKFKISPIILKLRRRLSYQWVPILIGFQNTRPPDVHSVPVSLYNCQTNVEVHRATYIWHQGQSYTKLYIYRIHQLCISCSDSPDNWTAICRIVEYGQ